MTQPLPVNDLLRAFGEALSLDHSKREAYLARLAENDPGQFRELQPLLEAEAERGRKQARSFASGQVIGGYTLVSLLGKGGFGQVWRAKKSGVGDVALKLMRLDSFHGEEFEKRFAIERAALQRLNHTGIASIHDGGIDPAPYYVMDLVEGSSIVEYAAAGDLDVEQRVELAIQLCLGIEHAHTQRVLHRDLKPANILVCLNGDLPRVVVIDFGIARLVDDDEVKRTQLTGEHQLRGTLAYMSPEQAGLTIAGERVATDERTDVFGIGRVLFELLTGEPALKLDGSARMAQQDAIDALLHQPPPSPRQRVARQQGGPLPISKDLDAIVQMATATHPQERYSSVRPLTEDLRSWLKGEQVVARRPGAMERARRYVRANRQPVIISSLVALFLVALVGVAERGRRTAESERERLELTLGAQVKHLQSLDVTAMGLELRRLLFEQITKHDPDAPVPAWAQGIDYVSLARAFFDSSYLHSVEEVYRAELQAHPLDLARVLVTLVGARRELGLHKTALPVAEEVYRIRLERLGEQADLTLASKADLVRAQRKSNKWVQTLEGCLELLNHWAMTSGPESRQALEWRLEEVLILSAQLDWAAAEAKLLPLCETIEAGFSVIPRNLQQAWLTLGFIQENTLRREAALGSMRKAYANAEKFDLHTPLDLAEIELGIGRLLAGMGAFGDQERLEEAKAIAPGAAETILEEYGDEHPTGLLALNTLASLARGSGDWEGTLEYSKRTWIGHRAAHGDLHPTTLRMQTNVVMGLIDTQQFAEGEDLAVKTIELCKQDPETNGVVTGFLIGERGRLRADQMQFAAAEPFLLDCYKRIEAIAGLKSAQVQQLRKQLAQFYGFWHSQNPSLGKDALSKKWSSGS